MMILLACTVFLATQWKLLLMARGKGVVVQPIADGIPRQVRNETDL